MPHVIVKLKTGRSGQQKARIAEAVTRAIMATADCDGGRRIGRHRG